MWGPGVSGWREGVGTDSEMKENGLRAASAVGLEVVPVALSLFPIFPFLFCLFLL
jgi:hypothetical protein